MFQKEFADLLKQGYARVKVDGSDYMLDEEIKLDKNIKHNISVVVDRLIIKPEITTRLTESLEAAIKLTGGIVVVSHDEQETLYSTNHSCVTCGYSLHEITPRLFSFNNPFGACPTCTGIGYLMKMDEDLIIPDKNKTLYEGVKAFGSSVMKKAEWIKTKLLRMRIYQF